MTMDLSNFYLMTPVHHPEFIHVKLSNIPYEVIEEYKLREKATKNGSVYVTPHMVTNSFQNLGLPI